MRTDLMEPDWRVMLARLRERDTYATLAQRMRERGYDVTEDQLKDIGKAKTRSPRWAVGAGILALHGERVRQIAGEISPKSVPDIAAL